MQDLVLGPDAQDQVVSEHDTIDMPVIADTTTKPKPKPKPKPKHGKGKIVDSDLELTEAVSHKWKSSWKKLQ